MKLEERCRDYINKAKSAEKKAAAARDADIREAWGALAITWRMLARHVRTQTRAEMTRAEM